MRFPSRGSILSGRRKPRRHPRRPTVASLEPLERRLLLAGDVFGHDAFASMTALTTTATGSSGVWDGTGSEQGQSPTTRVSTTTRVSDDGTSGVTITVSERWDSPDSWTFTETVSGWYDVSDDISDATGRWSVRAWGTLESTLTVSLASGTLHFSLVERGKGQLSERATTAWSGSAAGSSGSLTHMGQFDATTQFTAVSSGTTRSGVLTGFSGKKQVTGTSSSSWSMAASVAHEIEGGSVRGAVFDTGHTTNAFDASTRAVLDTGGRIVTTGDALVRGSGSGSGGSSVIAGSAWSVGFTGGTASAQFALQGFETQQWEHAYSATSALGPQGWRLVAGTASSGSEGTAASDWSASTRTAFSRSGVTASSMSQASGSDTASSRYDLTSTVSEGRWVTVGSGAAIGQGSSSERSESNTSESLVTSVMTSQTTRSSRGSHDSSYGYAIGRHYDDRQGWRTLAGSA